jgi:Cu-Zn family superoxide dismutase
MRHYGDMGNWQAVGGVINDTKTLDLLQLMGNTSIIGRAVVVHQGTDDCISNPAGNSGTRIGLGVIGIVNSTIYGGAGEAINNDGMAMSAIVHLQPASGSNVSGVVYLYQPTPTSATTVYALVSGITGNHGFHLHWWGDISRPDGTATGGHYNPNGTLHGIPPFAQRHIGDMGIISYNAAGISLYKYTNDYISLNGPYNVIGRAIHVHQNSDDCSNPVGTGGARWAQGVVGITNSSAFTAPNFPADVPVTQNGVAICTGIYTQSAMSSGSASASATNTATNSMSMSGSMSGSSGSQSASGSMSATSVTATRMSSGVERLAVYFVFVALAIAMLF